MQPDGKILAAGYFNDTNGVPTIGGQTRNRHRPARCEHRSGGFVQPDANDIVFTIAIQADNKVLVGGLFTTVAPNGGAAVTRNRIARMNTDGTLDSAWNPTNIVNTEHKLNQ